MKKGGGRWPLPQKGSFEKTAVKVDTRENSSWLREKHKRQEKRQKSLQAVSFFAVCTLLPPHLFCKSEPRENKQAERAALARGLVQTRCQPFISPALAKSDVTQKT